MTADEIKRFNFLEAAARVYLTDVEGEPQACVKHRTPAPLRMPGDRSYLVRYRDGHYYINAFIGDKRVVFKQRVRSVNITNVSIDKIKAYLRVRPLDKMPSVLIRDHVKKPSRSIHEKETIHD